MDWISLYIPCNEETIIRAEVFTVTHLFRLILLISQIKADFAEGSISLNQQAR